MLSNFLLEDIYNQLEDSYQSSISSGIIDPLSFAELEGISAFDSAPLFERMLKSKLDYTSRFGSKLVREQISSTLYQDLSPDDLILTSGASEAIFLLFSSLFEVGDTIVVQKPIYQSLYQIALDRGLKVIGIEHKLAEVDEFLGQVEAQLKTQKPKALVLNNPNNPTGFLLNNSALSKLTELCKEHGTWLIVDEVFAQIIPKQKSAINFYEQAIVISDLSKAFSLPGLRLGWIACKDKGLRSKFSSHKNYLSLRTNILAEIVAEEVLPYKQEILERNRKILASNFEDFVKDKNQDEFLSLFDYGKLEELDYVPPGIFPKLKDTSFDLPHYCQEILNKEQLFILEGECFDAPAHIRLGFGTNISAQLAKISSVKNDKQPLFR